METQEIRIEENGLKVIFEVRENGIVELKQFTTAGKPDRNREPRDKQASYSITEIQLTGKGSINMHGYKHNLSSESKEFHYVNHTLEKAEKGQQLIIHTKSDYGVELRYHMQFFDGISAVQVWTEVKNNGTEAVGLEYVSSFIYHGLCANGELPYYDKTQIYTPYNSWCCEAQWKKDSAKQLNLNGMMVDGFNTPGFGLNRYCYGGRGSWSSCEYLPMGICEDTEAKETYFFQIEHSGQWLVEYGSSMGKNLYLALSGPTEMENGWWKNLKPGDTFETVPVGFGVADGSLNEAMAELTKYRRAIRRENDDDKKLNIVFNDYMNCLMGDPIESTEKEIIDKAAEMGCEYYCMDAGWYDKGYWWDRVGEWKESPERFPNGMKSVCDYAKSKGLVMGLWLEIEVMGVECELAKKLPDNWFICRHGKRHIDNKRYLLDFRNPEVRAYCREVVDRLIEDYGVGYFKVDYNVTMGYGSELNSDSCSDAIREHYLCLYQWYKEIFKAHPDLVIENCGSGGQRMDYGMLKLLSLQSTSDQTDYIYNSYIGVNVASAVTPEQAGMWVYPYEDDREHVIYNMVNGLLLRPYISGMVWKMSEENLKLMAEGIALYKQIRDGIKDGVPIFPLGFADLESKHLVYGIKTEDRVYLAVLAPKTEKVEIPLEFEKKIEKVTVIYPGNVDCKFSYNNEKLSVELPQEKCARLFEIDFKK